MYHGFVQIKDIEKYLRRKLIQLSKSDGGSANLEVVGPKEKCKQVDYFTADGKLDAIDVSNGKITITSNAKVNVNQSQTIDVAEIIDASGRNVSIGLAGQDIESHKTDFDECHQPIDNHHFAVTLKLSSIVRKRYGESNWPIRRENNNGDKPGRFYQDSLLQQKDLIELKNQFGWNKNYLPRVYLVANKRRNKFYLAGAGIEGMDKDMAVKLGKFILNKHLGLPEEFLIVGPSHTMNEAEAAKKTQLKATTFNMQFSQTRPIRKFGQGHVIAVGDCVKPPNYTFAEGLNFAVASARKTIAAMSKNGNHIQLDKQGLESYFTKTVNASKEKMQKQRAFDERRATDWIDEYKIIFAAIKTKLNYISGKLNAENENDRKSSYSAAQKFIKECLDEVDKFESSLNDNNTASRADMLVFAQNYLDGYEQHKAVFNTFRGDQVDKIAGRLSSSINSVFSPSTYKKAVKNLQGQDHYATFIHTNSRKAADSIARKCQRMLEVSPTQQYETMLEHIATKAMHSLTSLSR